MKVTPIIDTEGKREWRIREKLHSFANPGRSWAVVVLFLVAQSLLLAYIAHVHSPTLNEPAHLAAGISHWQFGEFQLYRVNPPLVRMIAALPVMTVGAKTDWSKLHQDPAVRSEFAVGKDFIAANGEQSLFLFWIARLACIPFAWIGGVISFIWARSLYGPLAGYLALTLWCFSPNILAHAALVTPDAPATSLLLAACYLFWRWLQKPTWIHIILAGTVLGAAELAKTTFIIFYPILPLIWLFYRFPERATVSIHRRLLEGTMLLAYLAISLFATNLGYGFEGSFKRLGDFQFVSSMLSGRESDTPGNRFANTHFGNIPVPLPGYYVMGIDSQRRDFEDFGRPSYLAGEFKATGWWYYYLYALAIKVPLGDWGLLFLTIALRLRKQRQLTPPYTLRDELVLVTPAFLLFLVVSSQTGFSEHLRYVLPVFPFAFIWVSQIARLCATRLRNFAMRSSLSREGYITGSAVWKLSPAFMALGLLCWSLGSSLSIYPHSLSYFNELAGGPSGGPAYLLGSNADWGQDLRYLKWWLDDHPEIAFISLAYCGHYDPSYLGLKYSAPPPCDSKDGQIPKLEPGWYAVSVNFLQGYPWFAFDGHGGHVVYDRDALRYFRSLVPVAVAGTSIYIFHI